MDQEPYSFVESLISHSKRYWGLKMRDIEKTLGLNLNRRSKSYAANVIYHALGLMERESNTKEFKNVNINIKTVRCNPGLKPINTMSLRGYRYDEIIEEEWDNSKLKSDIENILMVVLTMPRKGAAQENSILETVLLHIPTDEDMKIIENDWKTIVSLIKENKADKLTGHIGQIVQTRPKAANSQDKISAPGGHMLVKKGFFIRTEYLQGILNKYMDTILKDID